MCIFSKRLDISIIINAEVKCNLDMKSFFFYVHKISILILFLFFFQIYGIKLFFYLILGLHMTWAIFWCSPEKLN